MTSLPKKMKWIGLTGGMGSGKSTAAQILRQLGYSVADADQLAREALQKSSTGFQQVIQAFGPGLLDAQGELNRAALAKVVFSDKSKLQQLESITHPWIQGQVQALRKTWAKQGQQISFYDVPLLYEKNLKNQFDGVLLISCSEELQIKRLKSRSSMSDEEIKSRLAHQISLDQKKLWADFIVTNEGSLEDLKGQLEEVLKRILNESAGSFP